MTCPSCDQPVKPGDPACPACGFCLEMAAARFGAVPRHGVYVTDTTQLMDSLTRGQHQSLERYLMFFERKFPQCRFSVFFTHLLPGRSIRELTFNLFNRCQFSAFEAKVARNFSLLLVVDTGSRDACLMTGYGLEPLLSTEDLEGILAAGRPAMDKRRYHEGVKACLDTTIKLLAQRHTEAAK